MAQVDAASFDAALKEYYSDEYVRDLVYEDNPLFALLPKKSDIVGDVYVQPVQFGIPMSRSAQFAVAVANKNTNLYRKFNVTTVDDFAVISISRKVMKQSATNRGAFFEARTREIDGMLKSLVRSISIALYRNGGGAIGRATYTAGDLFFTLQEPEDVTNFEVGQEIVSSSGDGSLPADLQDAGSFTVTAVNRDTGVVFSDAALNLQIPAFATGRFVFPQGDFGGAAGLRRISGLGRWIPTVAPIAGDSHFGVDRSVDATRLGGIRVSGVGLPIAEALRNGAARLGREGASPSHVFMSHQKYRDLVLELGNKVEYKVDKPMDANVGFRGVEIIGSKKPIMVLPDHNCPDGLSYMLMLDSWKLISLGPIPDLHDEDGIRMLREATSDGFEVRASYYAQLVSDAPGYNAVITLE